MNSYFLEITSSWLVYIVSLIFSFALAIYVYTVTIPPIGGAKKTLLVLLRAFALSFLFLLIFDPVLSYINTRIKGSQTLIAIDNSSSMLSNTNENQRSKLVRTNIQNILNNTSIYMYDNELKQIEDLESEMKFDGVATNIDYALKNIYEQNRRNNPSSLIVVSDGFYNNGSNPLYTTIKQGLPIIAIGVGDTGVKSDSRIDYILVNKVVYSGLEIPVNVEIECKECGDEILEVVFFEDDKELSKQVIETKSGKTSYRTNFNYKPMGEGDRKISVKIDPIANDFNLSNNTKSQIIKVIKEKRKVAIVSGAPSYDVSFVIKALSEINDIEISKIIQKKGSELYDKKELNNLNKAELMILIGFPNYATDRNLIDKVLAELRKGKSAMFIPSSDLDYNKLKMFNEFLPYQIVSHRPNEFQAALKITSDGSTSSLFKSQNSLSIEDWENLTPNYKQELFVKAKKGTEVLANMTVNNKEIIEPMIISSNIGQHKILALTFYGLYKWKLSGVAEELSKGRKVGIDFLPTFMQNAYKWLSADATAKKFTLKSSFDFYSPEQSVTLIGEVYDDSFNPVLDANINVVLKGKNETRELVLSHVGNGRYSVDIKGLKQGKYSFIGKANYGSRDYEEESGIFYINDVSLEDFDKGQNVSLLKSMASQTGGKYYNGLENLEEALVFASQLAADNEKVENLKESFKFRLSYLPLLLALILFSLEWFVRKRSGLL